MGTIKFVSACLKSFGKEAPSLPTYPTALRPFMRRRVWDSTLRDLIRDFDSGSLQCPIFVKPAYEAKRFNGFVACSSRELSETGAPRGLRVSCSEEVEFASEWRYYLRHDEFEKDSLVHRDCYAGDESLQPDQKLIDDCETALAQWDGRPAAYALDIGVLTDGRTAVVEINDGYAVGWYGEEVAPYLEFLVARWKQMVR